MYYYYFRQLKKDNGCGIIRVAKIIEHGEPFEYYSTNEAYKGRRLWFNVKIDDNDFILPKNKPGRGYASKKTHWNYNRDMIPYEEGVISNRTFWLQEYDLKRAQEIVNNYFKEKMEHNSIIYGKIINSTIEVEES